MVWTERQQAMLGAMGLKVWSRPQARTVAPEAAPAPAAPALEAPAQPRPAAPVQARVQPPAAQPLRELLPAKAPAPQPPAQAAAAPLIQVQGLDWDALQQAVRQCQACTLSSTRTQTVFGVGHAKAHWLVVGEAPGEQEDLQGEPFVGPAGQLLDNMLRAVGLQRGEGSAAQQVFIANTLKCRPPRNRNPDPTELAQCAPYLQRQIELVRPRIILAMGRFAAQALLGSSEPLGKLRGRVHEVHGRPVIVTYHPAYLLRNLTDKARAWEDLCLARRTYESRLSDPTHD
ncbi:uracil-DNA glycosylase family protein [Roseateles sp. BYS180W]|uniref:Type-4 uracil-DNA glycosylase n=1 Tax=Roseateles rivi TaxID=3299028 RepID=A0ABW7FWL7_9BURK